MTTHTCLQLTIGCSLFLGWKGELISAFLSLSNQKWWELPAFVQPMCREHKALIELLLDKAEAAYWANAPTCWDRSHNVTSKCIAGTLREREETQVKECGRKSERKERCEMREINTKVGKYIPPERLRQKLSLFWTGSDFLTSHYVTVGVSCLLQACFPLLTTNLELTLE